MYVRKNSCMDLGKDSSNFSEKESEKIFPDWMDTYDETFRSFPKPCCLHFSTVTYVSHPPCVITDLAGPLECHIFWWGKAYVAGIISISPQIVIGLTTEDQSLFVPAALTSVTSLQKSLTH